MTSLRTYLIAGLAIFLIGGFAGYKLHGSPAPSPAVQIAEQSRDTAVKVAAKTDTIYHTVSNTLTKTLTQYDTVRKFDTVTVDHVVYVNAQVADNTVKACRDEQSACVIRHSADSTVPVRDAVVIAALKADRPSRLHSLTKDALLLGIGYGAGRLNIGAHIRF